MLKDGASAVYGSDAIAGVVNFILKDRFEGIQIRAQAGVLCSRKNRIISRLASGPFGSV